MPVNSSVPELGPEARPRTGKPSRRLASHTLRRILRACDAVGFAAGWSAAWLTGVPREARNPVVALAGLAAIVATALVICSVGGLYRTGVASIRAVAHTRLMTAAAGSGVAAALIADRTGLHSGWARPASGAALSFGLAALARYVFDLQLRQARKRGAYARPVTIVGSTEEVQLLNGFLAANPELGYVVASAVGCERDPGLGVPWHPHLADARRIVTGSGATAAIVFGSGFSISAINQLARELTAARIPLQFHTGLVGVSYRRLRPTPIGHEPFLQLAPLSEAPLQLAAKRVVDIVGSLLGLVLTAPILITAAVAIKLHDGGPVFFRQTRVGRDGKPIRVHKLRTMTADAEARLPDVQPLNERMGPLFKTENDPRVTTVGKILRRTSIDEIPQLFDVLRGDMSLVGPRPALPEEVAAFDDVLLGRLRVRPGVTGLWQVEAREKPSFDAYRRLDLFYVEDWSIVLDLAIIVDTVPAVVGHAISGLANVARRRRTPASVRPTLPPFTTSTDVAIESESLTP
jgi:exopolysaccharide biosynthesis polyprenyl glycosylphosphotransferase